MMMMLNYLNSAPSINEFIDNEDKIHFEELKKGLNLNGISFEENHQLVRGLDYYCKLYLNSKLIILVARIL